MDELRTKIAQVEAQLSVVEAQIAEALARKNREEQYSLREEERQLREEERQLHDERLLMLRTTVGHTGEVNAWLVLAESCAVSEPAQHLYVPPKVLDSHVQL